jgi:hypothetical protein
MVERTSDGRRALGMHLRVVDVQAANDLVGKVFPSLLQEQPDALFVMPDAIFMVQPMPLVDFARTIVFR